MIRDWIFVTSALAASIDFPGRVEPGLLTVQRGAGGLHHGLLDVELFAGDRLAREEGAGACELELVQLQLAIGLGDRGVDLERLGLLLGDGRLGSRQFRLEGDGVHLGDDLAGLDHVPLVNEDRLDAARLLGRHVHLDRLDPPVPRGDPRRKRRQPCLPRLPGENPAPGQEGQQEDPERFPLHRGRSRGFR